MPVNFTQEYLVAERRYQEAKTGEEKITCLEEMIRQLPKHKGAENVRAQLVSRLSKLRKEAIAKKKKGGRVIGIAKEGEAQVCLIGKTMSGKSLVLSKITNARPKIASHPYTTVKPEVGMMNWNGVLVQIVEIPSTMESRHLSICRTADLVALVCKDAKGENEMEEFLKDNFIRTKHITINASEYAEDIKKDVWNALGMILVYTKKTKTPMALKKGGTVEGFCVKIHKDFLKNFRLAIILRKVKGKERKMQAGLKYKLEDGDIVEIFTQ